MNIRHILLNGRNISRAIRFALGIFIVVQSVIFRDYVMVIPGVLVAVMGLMNIGRCSAGSCHSYKYRAPKEDSEIRKEGIIYEEVK
ncbi:MAG: hypothetical protein N3F09_06670 [Bacteroidia bacterium]|nr:hypothetical protein [Bacteroidia bacterium]